MLSSKKRVDLQRNEVAGNPDEPIDFWRVITNAIYMGLTKWEIEHMRLGEYYEIFDVYKELYNMQIEKKVYILPEKRVSMMDL